MAIKLKNGIFLAPFHPVDEDPTLCIQRDLELVTSPPSYLQAIVSARS